MTKQIKVGIFQFENVPNCAAHIFGSILISDLKKKKNIKVNNYIVNKDCYSAFIKHLTDNTYNLICLDIFEIELINKIKKKLPDTKILMGGHSSIYLFLKSKADLCLFGGHIRENFNRLIDTIAKNSFDFSCVKNLFYKERKESKVTIKHTGKEIKPLHKEIIPFRPELIWGYIGDTERVQEANYEELPLILDSSCPLSKKRSIQNFDWKKEFNYIYDDSAEKFLEGFINNQPGGCNFCLYQYQKLNVVSSKEREHLIKEQLLFYSKKREIQTIILESELPFHYLIPVSNYIVDNHLPIKIIGIRSRPDWILQNKGIVVKALDLCKKNNKVLKVLQVGYENFSQKELDLFNKQLDVKTNIECLNFLENLKKKYGKNIIIDEGHGMIVFTPFTTMNDLKKNISAVSKYPYLQLSRRLAIVNPWLQIVKKIREHNLLIEFKDDAPDFKFKDWRVNLFWDCLSVIEKHYNNMHNNLFSYSLEKNSEDCLAISKLLYKKVSKIKSKKDLNNEKKQEIISQVDKILHKTF